ncbi:10272_t:CDS:1, partial [Paraglomus brasilianum]
MATTKSMSNFPLLCIAQIISELSEDSNDLYSCLLVNRMWCKCAVKYLWQMPFSWCEDNGGRMLTSFLQLLPSESLDDLEYIMGMDIPPPNLRPMFNYLGFVRTLNLSHCAIATTSYLDTVNPNNTQNTHVRLLLLRLCREIVINCPFLNEIYLDELDFDDIDDSVHRWSARAWNLFSIKDVGIKFNRLRQFTFTQAFHPDILYTAAEKLTKLEVFEFHCSDYPASDDVVVWCDAISKLIRKQERLRVLFLSLDFESPQNSWKLIWKAVCTQANTLRRIEIQFAEVNDIFSDLGRCTNLHEIELHYCTFYPSYYLQLPSAAFSHLHTLKLYLMETNSYGIETLFRNVKESLKVLSVEIIGALFDVETWRECARKAPNLIDFEVLLNQEESISLIEIVLPLWKQLKKLKLDILPDGDDNGVASK